MTQQSSSKGGNRNTASGSLQAGQNTSREMGDQVKETVGQVADQAQQAAGQVVDQARQQASSRIAGQKDRAAEGLSSVAHALRQTGQQLRQQDQQGVTDYIDRAASQVERFSSYLQQHDLGQLVDDVELFARRQPALFIGGAFVLGLLGARFLKSSRPYTPPVGGYTGGTYMTQPGRYYTGYPGGANYPGASGVSGYRPAPQSGSYPTTGRSTTGQSSSYGTGESSSYGTGPRTYDRQREE